MKTEQEIREEIEHIKNRIVEKVMTGVVVERSLQDDKNSIEVLEWVLD